MNYSAAIDIGSNALRLAIGKKVSDGFHITYQRREPVRLGADVFHSGAIESKTYIALEKAMIKFKNQLDNFKVKNYRAVATSAMRDAQNSQEIVEKLRKETGINIEVISGDEEARLVFDAIAQKIDFNSDSHLLIDIGGGSIELVAVFMSKIIKKKSFQLGTVRILSSHEDDGQPDIEPWLKQRLHKALDGFFVDLAPFDNCVGTGGNMDRFAKIKEIKTGTSARELLYEEIEVLKSQLLQCDFEERIQTFQIARDRADVIVPAAIVTETIMQMAGAKVLKLPQVGLKEGLLYHLFSQNS